MADQDVSRAKMDWVKKHIDPIIEDLDIMLGEFRAKSRFVHTHGTIEGLDEAHAMAQELSRKHQYLEVRNKIIIDLVGLLDGFDTMRSLIIKNEQDTAEFPTQWVDKLLDSLIGDSDKLVMDIESLDSHVDTDAIRVLSVVLNEVKDFVDACARGEHTWHAS